MTAIASGSGSDENTESGRIRIVAAVITDNAGRVLVVRKRGTKFFMQPGGKSEKDELPENTLARELREELGCELVGSEFLGVYSAPAANEPQHLVEAALFRAAIAGDVAAHNEIEEIAWIDPAQPCSMPLAPLTCEFALRWQRLHSSGHTKSVINHAMQGSIE